MSPSILVTLLLVTGPYSLNVGEARIVIDKSKAHYSEAGLELKIPRIVKMRDRYAQLETISESRLKFNLYRDFLRTTRKRVKGRTHVVLPPLIESTGIRFIGGFAESGCNPKGVGVSNAQRTRSNGLDGLEPSSIALSHEIAHTAGAKHEDGVNIMHPAALQFTGQPIGFLQSTVYRMKRCLGRGK